MLSSKRIWNHHRVMENVYIFTKTYLPKTNKCTYTTKYHHLSMIILLDSTRVKKENRGRRERLCFFLLLLERRSLKTINTKSYKALFITYFLSLTAKYTLHYLNLRIFSDPHFPHL